MRIAVAVIFPGDLLQHPATPVQKATNITINETIKRAIAERPISGKRITVRLITFCENNKIKNERVI